MKTFIMAGGNIDYDFVKKYLLENMHASDVCIAADAGIKVCEKLQIEPRYIIGDFDSLSQSERDMMDVLYGTYNDTEIITLSPIKDDTDTEAALQLAFKKTEGEIYILGATGKRLDHTYGNIELLRQADCHGRDVFILDTYNRIRMVKNTSCKISKKKQFGKYVSIFPVGGVCHHVTVTGMYYNLEDATMEGGNTLGVSNEIVDREAEISVGDGTLLVVESRD